MTQFRRKQESVQLFESELHSCTVSSFLEAITYRDFALMGTVCGEVIGDSPNNTPPLCSASVYRKNCLHFSAMGTEDVQINNLLYCCFQDTADIVLA